MRAAIRSLGRLRDEAGFAALVALLDDTHWARAAADALGDFGDPRAVPPLLAAYGKFAKRIDGSDPARVPPDDKMGFPSIDRMLETPYAIALALSRLSISEQEDLRQLYELIPRILVNMPGDHDTFMLYEPEVGHLLTRHLIQRSGRQPEARQFVLSRLSSKAPGTAIARAADGDVSAGWPDFDSERLANWLTVVCTQRSDVDELVALLHHDNGWVRLNAAKTLAWIGDPRAVEPIAQLLAGAKPESAYGYSSVFKDEEYNDPAPRWREGMLRALGLLGAHQHTKLIIQVLNDEDSVVEVRHAAARRWPTWATTRRWPLWPKRREAIPSPASGVSPRTRLFGAALWRNHNSSPWWDYHSSKVRAAN